MTITADQHVSGWGRLAGNLLAVEQLLRIFLGDACGETLEYPKAGETEVKLTHLTNRDSLGALLSEFNNQLGKDEANYKIDTSIVDTRDAMAHGRVVGMAEYPVTLYRFGKPTGDRVPVVNADVLDKAWFTEKTELAFAQIQRIAGCSKKRGYKSIK